MPEHGPYPVVGLPADLYFDHGLGFHRAGDKYLRPLAEISGVLPVIVPADTIADPRALIEHLDGVLLTGGLSNVHPEHYGATPEPGSEPYDRARDATSFALVRHAVDLGLPVFAICRGNQELNVALGGTLHSEVQDMAGKLDHRAPKVDSLEERYGPRHPITIVEGGQLHSLLGAGEITVNSLHRQAIDQLAPGMRVEANAADGTIEAVSLPDAAAFTLGVQWHPEYKAKHNAVSCKLFEAFGDAVRGRMAERNRTNASAPVIGASGGMGSWTNARAEQND